MRKSLLVLLILFTSLAKAKEVGLGIILGYPSAITGKYWMDEVSAIDAGLGFSLNEYIMLYGDYLYHFPKAFGGKSKFSQQLTPYVGIGGVFVVTNTYRDDDDKFYGKKSGAFGLGMRIPVGIEWRPAKPKLGVFLELAPGLSVIPKTSGFIQAGIGARYYFN